MKLFEKLVKLSLNKRLALTAAMLGVTALFVGNPYHGAKLSVDKAELALMVQKESDQISPIEIAEWIIQNKIDYRLIDLRDENDFAEYHIPTAENIIITELGSSSLMRNEKIVLYSKDGIHAAKAWFLLKADNYKNVYTLYGGLNAWKDKILFPRVSETIDNSEAVKIAEISKFFGGQPQNNSQTETAAKYNNPMPKISTPAANPLTPSKKKKKEGC